MHESNIYTCSACMYTFQGESKPELCPDCGKAEVRPATDKERDEYLANKALADDARPERTSKLQPDLSAEETAELERVIGVMRPYIQECPLYDVIWSDKFGYLLVTIPGKKKSCDSDAIQLDDPRKLLDELYSNLAYDFMEDHGYLGDYEAITPEDVLAMRDWMCVYTDQLPEYDDVLEHILAKLS